MTDCTAHEKHIESLLAGEIAPAEVDRLVAHLEECRACSGIGALHRDLSAGEVFGGEPTDGDLAGMRASVLDTLEEEKAAEADVMPFPSSPRAAAMETAASDAAGSAAGGGRLSTWGPLALAAALALGFALVAGRMSAPPGDPSAGDARMSGRRDGLFAGASAPAIEAQIQRAARQHTDLASIENSPLVYSDVRITELEDDLLDLEFDVTTHVSMIRPKTDPVAVEVMVQSLVNPSSLGSRIQTIALADDVEDVRVTQALVRAMKEDPSQAVRLLALERLAEHKTGPAIEAAFLSVLAQEESVQMRLQAIDYLTSNRVEREALEKALGQADEGTDRAIRLRAEPYLSAVQSGT